MKPADKSFLGSKCVFTDRVETETKLFTACVSVCVAPA